MPKKKAEKPKLVLDSNVFISALVFGGKPRQLLELAIKGMIDVAISDEILEEIKGVLQGRKFRYPVKTVRTLIKEIEDLADLVEPEEKTEAVPEDPAESNNFRSYRARPGDG